MARPQYLYDVNTFRPSAKILVYSGNNTYELESDLFSIARSKQMGQASGQWAIQLVDRVGTDGLTWQQRIQTGDYIEVYQANDPKSPQLTMRGFVISSQHSFDIQGTNGPTRYTQLTGVDMGYIFQANQVRYLWQIDPTALFGTQYQLDANFGIGAGPYTPSQLLDEFMSKIVNGVGVYNMQQVRGSGTPPYFATECDLPDQYSIVTTNVQAFTGAYWNLMSYYASAPFAELFYIDLPGEPTLYYRQPPYRALDGSYLGVFGTPLSLLPTVTVNLANKKSHALSRTCNEMYCFMFTYSDQVPLSAGTGFNYAFFFGGSARNISHPGQGQNSVGVHHPSNPIYDKSIESRYGFQQLSVNTPFISSPSSSAATANESAFQTLATSMNTWMYNVFKNNDQFESGTITVHGDPNITIGRYVHVPEWGMDFYVTGITDNFVQYQTWTMDLQVIRGYTYGSNTKPQIYSSSGSPAPPPAKPTPPAPPSPQQPQVGPFHQKVPSVPGTPTFIGPAIPSAPTPPPPPNTHPAFPGGPNILGH